MLILIALIGSLSLCLLVFGGGQVYVPLFKSLWNIMNEYGKNLVLTSADIDNIIASANSTPGVIGTKLSMLTGYLAANGEWYAFFIAILTYLVFVIPAILMVIISYKYLNKVKSNPTLKKIFTYMKPIIVGSVIALCLDLIISWCFPMIYFNVYGGYAGIKENYKTDFLKNWRLVALFIYFPISICSNFYLCGKKFSPLFLVIVNILICLIIFQPWIN